MEECKDGNTFDNYDEKNDYYVCVCVGGKTQADCFDVDQAHKKRGNFIQADELILIEKLSQSIEHFSY